jgi:hypothetical protein
VDFFLVYTFLSDDATFQLEIDKVNIWKDFLLNFTNPQEYFLLSGIWPISMATR